MTPGDSTWVEIILGTGRMIGQVEKHTRVTGNAIGRIPVFTIQAHVLTDSAVYSVVTLNPRAAYVDAENPPALENGKWRYAITLKNTSGQSLNLHAIDVPQEFVVLASDAVTIPAGGSAELVMLINPEISDLPFAKSVTFELSDREKTRISIPVGKRPEY